MPRRIIILGGPQVGKTTLSQRLKDELQIPVLHSSDDIKHLGWSESSAEASKWFSEPGDWICEGVQMARALRKWLLANPNVPLDADVISLDHPFVDLSAGQQSMTAGVKTVLGDIEAELLRRGARVQKLKTPDDAIGIFNSARDAQTNTGKRDAGMHKKTYTKVEWEALPETTRKFFVDEKLYVADGDNFKLEAEGIEDPVGLKTALQKEREARNRFEKELKEERERFQGVDLDKYNQLLAEADAKETDELKSKGKIDELIDKHNKEKKSINDGWQKKYDELMVKHDQLRIDHRLRKAFEDGGVIPDRIDDAVELTKKRVKLTEKDDIQILEDGSPIDASLEIYAKELLKEQKPWLYAASAAGGTGAQNGTHSPDRMPDLSKLSPTERLKYANANPQVTQGRS